MLGEGCGWRKRRASLLLGGHPWRLRRTRARWAVRRAASDGPWRGKGAHRGRRDPRDGQRRRVSRGDRGTGTSALREVGFTVVGAAETRLGPAVRMRRQLQIRYASRRRRLQAMAKTCFAGATPRIRTSPASPLLRAGLVHLGASVLPGLASAGRGVRRPSKEGSRVADMLLRR